MPRMTLIQAGPTPWDQEGRLEGSRPLPLTLAATSAVAALAAQLPGPVDRVFCPVANEACAAAAGIVAARFELKARDEPLLEEVSLGLWEGLTREELRFRFPTAFPQWEQAPLAVVPPDGEPLAEAVARLGDGLARVRRRSRRCHAVLALRPMAMQILIGLLRNEPVETIASHLHDGAPVETMEDGR